VKEPIPPPDKSIAQMAAFARSIPDRPAEFIRERAAVAAEDEFETARRPLTAMARPG
jgi:hypothetical protein